MNDSVPPLPVHTGLYFEEYHPGQIITSPGRTITEADVVAFAGLTGDWSSIHTDADYAARHPMGKRIAHGMLGISVASGLAVRMGFLEGTLLAMRDIENWKFSSPIFLGDTVFAKIKVKQTKPVPHLNAGFVRLGVDLINQDGKVVQTGAWSIIVMCRPENSGSSGA